MPNGMLGDNAVLRELLNGPLCTLLERLNGEQGPEWDVALKRFLRREDPWKERKLLEYVQTIEVPLAPNFNIDCFKKNSSLNSTVAIWNTPHGDLWWSATESKKKGLPPKQKIRVHRLLRAERIGIIKKELGPDVGHVELAAIWQLLLEQPRCEKGPLATCPEDERGVIRFAAHNCFLVAGPKKDTPWFFEVINHPREAWQLVFEDRNSERLKKGDLVFTAIPS